MNTIFNSLNWCNYCYWLQIYFFFEIGWLVKKLSHFLCNEKTILPYDFYNRATAQKWCQIVWKMAFSPTLYQNIKKKHTWNHSLRIKCLLLQTTLKNNFLFRIFFLWKLSINWVRNTSGALKCECFWQTKTLRFCKRLA